MSESIAGFNWDGGNVPKCQRHRVTIGEIEAAFQGPMHVLPATGQSATEARYIAVGRSASGRPLLMVFTYREINRRRLIRPISARFMHAKEVIHYEAQIQALETASSSGE